MSHPILPISHRQFLCGWSSIERLAKAIEDAKEVQIFEREKRARFLPYARAHFPYMSPDVFFERNLTRPIFAMCQTPFPLLVTGCVFLENLIRPIFAICRTHFRFISPGMFLEKPHDPFVPYVRPHFPYLSPDVFSRDSPTCQSPIFPDVTGCIFSRETSLDPFSPHVSAHLAFMSPDVFFSRTSLDPFSPYARPYFPFISQGVFSRPPPPPSCQAPFFPYVTGCIFSRMSDPFVPYVTPHFSYKSPDVFSREFHACIFPIFQTPSCLYLTRCIFRRLASTRRSLQRAATSWSGRWRPPSHAPRVCSPTRRICPICRTPMFFISHRHFLFVCFLLSLDSFSP